MFIYYDFRSLTPTDVVTWYLSSTFASEAKHASVVLSADRKCSGVPLVVSFLKEIYKCIYIYIYM